MLDNITEIQKLKLHENEVLVVKVPLDDQPRQAWLRHANDLRTSLSTMLLSNNILVIDDHINFTVIEKENTERDYTEHF
jgi:hypothetical protein